MMDINGKKILITGAGGFVGSRLCERIYLGYDAKPTALVRNLGRACRIGRMRIPLVKGDILDKDLMDKLIGDSDIVIHLVAGGTRSIVDGTRIIARLCRKHGVARMVHMSSAAVYGIRSGEDHIREDAPLRKTGDAYPDAKIEAEKIVIRETEKGLPAVVLRPRIVWGPYSTWVETFYSRLRDNTFCLVDNGDGACNTVYIDNLIDATLLAIENDRAVGEVFFVTDDEKISWRTFYTRWASFLDQEIRFVSVDSASFLQSHRKPGVLQETKAFLTSPTFKNLLVEAPIFNRFSKKVFESLGNLPDQKKIWIKDFLGVNRPEKNMRDRKEESFSVDIGRIKRESGRGYTDITKIKTTLGYQPGVDFRTGSELTKEWLAFAGILNSR
jgi:nucleoside-diphosphate-sugar epimerase